MSKSIAVIQSHYVPWAGFFDLIGGCTDVVLLDSVSYSKNSFFNRNRLYGPNGYFWLTIPLRTEGRMGQRISEVEISDKRWVKKHSRSIEQCLSSSPKFEEVSSAWSNAFVECQEQRYLAQVNRIWLDTLISQLGLTTAVHDDSFLSQLNPEKNSRLIQICKHFGATTYRTGPRAAAYLDVAQFETEGIQVEQIVYGSYYSYRMNTTSAPEPISVLDNLANMGCVTRDFLAHQYVKMTP